MVDSDTWGKVYVFTVLILIVLVLASLVLAHHEADQKEKEALQGPPTIEGNLTSLEYNYFRQGSTHLTFNNNTKMTIQGIDRTWEVGVFYKVWIHNGYLLKVEVIE